MRLTVKEFDELTTNELYELLKARAEIFVVEQNCAYQDLDDIDHKSLHVFYQDENGKVLAYLRAFQKPEKPGTIQLGRVLTLQHGIGRGEKILYEGILAVRKKFDVHTILIEAQKYAVGFYEREGFKICSDEFLEDGIPHVEMELRL